MYSRQILIHLQAELAKLFNILSKKKKNLENLLGFKK